MNPERKRFTVPVDVRRQKMSDRGRAQKESNHTGTCSTISILRRESNQALRKLSYYPVASEGYVLALASKGSRYFHGISDADDGVVYLLADTPKEGTFYS